MNPTLVILAAGLGSRYGGLKQIDALGPHGESIIDYSIHDAHAAGFGRIIFVIKAEHETQFRQRFDHLAETGLEIAYAHQRMDDLPVGHACPVGRVKPWGTGHAIYSARKLLDGPFGVITADDFYGRDTFVQLHRFLTTESAAGKWGMVVHRLVNTLPPEGRVSRGVCQVENGMLASITERTDVRRTDNGIVHTEAGVDHPLADDALVSLVVWGMHPSCFAAMEADLTAFLDSPEGDPLKREYYMPAFVDRQVAGGVSMRALETTANWYGVTYQEDRPAVVTALADMHAAGLYPALK